MSLQGHCNLTPRSRSRAPDSLGEPLSEAGEAAVQLTDLADQQVRLANVLRHEFVLSSVE
jgi:hypothetical protein